MENMSGEKGADYQAIAENSTDAVLIITGEGGNIVYCNSQVEKLSGFSADELLSHRFVEFLHPQEQKKLLQNYQQRLEGKSIPERYMTRVVAEDGRIIPVEIKAQKISWNNQPADFINLKDISDLKWLESYVHAHKEALEGLGENVTITDNEGTVVYTSEKFYEKTGVRKDGILGHNLTEFFPPEFHEQFPEIFKSTISGKPWQGEVTVRWPEGRVMEGWVHMSPLFNNEGKFIGTVGVSVDIKERKQLEERLQTQGQLRPVGQGEKEAAAEKRLEIYYLGTLRVCSSDKQIQQWPGKRAREVFEYLASKTGTPVTSDVLMETLWPGSDRKSAANSLRTAVHNLRQTLESLIGDDDFPSVLFSHGGYLINPELELTLDTEEFERHCAQGRRLEKEKKTDAAMKEYEQAEALYRGDYLEDEPYEDWTMTRRETLKDTYLLVLGKLADYYLNMADYERCILYCQKTLAKDACREDVYRRLMCCYSRLGQRNRAIQWYKTCRRIVRAELHTPPDRKTVELCNRLMNGEEI